MRSSSQQYILEIDDGIYRYRNGYFSQIENIDEIKEHTFFITDFPDAVQQAISRVVTVETEPKYAPVMAGKKLQEEGEFTDPVHIINHTSRKKGANRTELFYTAVSASLYAHYQDKITESSEGLLIFPLYGVLLQIIKKIKPKQPVALIFRHGRHADLLIAGKKTVYYANRATSFDYSEDQVNSLWNIIENDLNNVERQQKISINQCTICNWFDAPDKPDWQNRTVNETPSTNITIDGESKSCSLLPLLDLLNPADSIGSVFSKFTYFTKQFLPIIQIILFLLGVGLLTSSFLFQTKTEAVQQEIKQAKQKIINLTNFTLAANIDYQETLKLLNELDLYRQSKTFKTLVNDLSSAISRHTIINQIKADVQNKQMTIQVHGTIKTGFQAAYQGYQSLIQNLKQNKYTIAESTFNTEIDQAEFILTYTSTMGEN
jgi:hypothetical protein